MVARVLSLLIFASLACQRGPTHDPALVAAHAQEIARWRAERLERLRSRTGWLTLAGLFWLKPGENSVGSGPESDVRLPASAPATVGTITLADGRARLRAAAGTRVTVDEKPVTEVEMVSDARDDPTVARLGPVHFFVIDRGERLGVRVRDETSHVLARFRGIATYPVDYAWRLEGRFERHETPRALSVPNVLGSETRESSPGAVIFAKGGETFRLQTVAEAGAEELFVVFADQTNRDETYGGGRFLYVAAPPTGADAAAVVIDFNKAYNPPCAFTPYATCPLPPKENRLDLRVTAGEKRYGAH